MKNIIMLSLALINSLVAQSAFCNPNNNDNASVLTSTEMKDYASTAAKESNVQLAMDWAGNVGVLATTCSVSAAIVIASGALQSVPVVSVFSTLNEPCRNYIEKNTKYHGGPYSPESWGWALGGAAGNVVAVCGYIGASIGSAFKNIYTVAAGEGFNWTGYSFTNAFLEDMNKGAYAPTILLSKSLFGNSSGCVSAFHKRALIEAELKKRF
jgi:hypothetical protein